MKFKSVKLFGIFVCLVVFAVAQAEVGDECINYKGTDSYEKCLNLTLAIKMQADFDCPECWMLMTQDRKPSTGEQIGRVLETIAGPLAYFGSQYMWARNLRKTNEAWADAYIHRNDVWSSAYKSGYAACTNRFNTYMDYLQSRGGLPVAPKQMENLIAQCNIDFPGMFAGMGGMYGNGFGGFGNPFLSAGYTPGFMAGMLGPYFGGGMGGVGMGGIYPGMMGMGLGMRGMGFPGMGLPGMGMGGIGAGVHLGLGLGGLGLNIGAGGMGMHPGMGMYPGMGMGFGCHMCPGTGMGYGMYPGMGAGAYFRAGGGYPGMMSPYGYGMYPGAGMVGGFNLGGPGMWGAGMGMGTSPWGYGNGSYWNATGGWGNGYGRWNQRYNGHMQWQQQQQQMYQRQLDLQGQYQAYAWSTGNSQTALAAQQALAANAQRGYSNYHQNLYNGYRFAGSAPYSMGNIGWSAGGHWGGPSVGAGAWANLW